MNGFRISGSNPYVARGISGGGLIRNGEINQIVIGIDTGGRIRVEDVTIRATGSGVIASDAELRRVTIRSAGGLVTGVRCGQCFLQDVTIGVSGETSLVGGEGVFERLIASADSVFIVSGSATIIDSSIGSFSIGDDSSMEGSTANCIFPYNFTSRVASAGTNFQMKNSTFVVDRFGAGCLPVLGAGARVENSAFGQLDAGPAAVLRGNYITLARRRNHSVSVGIDSIVEDNSIEAMGGSLGNNRVGVQAGNGSQIFNNSIQGADDGISCGENCVVTVNTISDYSGTGLTLGSMSYYFGNQIDSSGLVEVSGGIRLDSDALGVLDPTRLITPRAETDLGDDMFPQIATDGMRSWVAIWESSEDLGDAIGLDYDILYVRTNDGGLTWTDPAALNSTASDDSAIDDAPALAADRGAGNWIAAWRSNNDLNGTVGNDWDIFVARSSDLGATWSAAIPLNTDAAADSGADLKPFLASDGQTFVAVWESDSGVAGPDFDIRFSRSIDGGATWSPPALLNTSAVGDTANDTNAVVATNGGNKWLAVWETDASAFGADGDLLVARSIDSGLTWSAPSLLNTNGASDTGLDRSPDIAADRDGAWVVTWESRDSLGGAIGTDRDILFSRSTNHGLTWTTPNALNDNAGFDAEDDSNPKIATDLAGTWTVVWDSRDSLGSPLGSDADIFVSRSTDAGATWSSPSPLNHTALSDLGDDSNPRIATEPAGLSMIVWHSEENLMGAAGLDWDVFFSGLDRCNSIGALGPSTAELAAFQNNRCEDWFGVAQSSDNLESAILKRTDLGSADLTLVNLSDANLAGANLAGANMTAAQVQGSILTEAEYNAATVFPSGDTYDIPIWGLDGGMAPWDAGMIPVPEPSFGLLLFSGVAAIVGLSARPRN